MRNYTSSYSKGKSEGCFGTRFEKLLGGGIVYQNEYEMFLKRRSRREIVEGWKKAAKAIKDKSHKMLLREARLVALTIIEDAARSMADFDRVNIIWDEVEVIESWRLEKHEQELTEELLEDELRERQTDPAAIRAYLVAEITRRGFFRRCLRLPSSNPGAYSEPPRV